MPNNQKYRKNWKVSSSKTYSYTKANNRRPKKSKKSKKYTPKYKGVKGVKSMIKHPKKFVKYITNPSPKKMRTLISAENTLAGMLMGYNYGFQGYTLWNAKDKYLHPKHRSYRGKWIKPFLKHF